MLLLVVTLALFPLLYATLELPKQIINGAIGAETDVINVWGYRIDQISYLLILCGFFLLAVLAHGLLKMRINTMKGVLAERLLRRFRYTLIARILRFPAPYFERTSQGELVSMVTAESEPMGGLMGDALAQPVLQAGQMLTILGFLFAQSVTFGLAACALIPLQAWLIPKMQRQINQLNKKRVIEVRALASEIGEAATGASTLRLHGGWRYRLAMITDRLGRLFRLRFEIYQKKFFMKFTNNFITQLTPLLFYAIGGILVIRGEVSLGALVAALAAYKDLSSPWKELLAYYNQVQDMSLRWQIITERFAPAGMVSPALFDGTPDNIPKLTGDIHLDHVTLRDADGDAVLEDIHTTLPGGGLIGITAPNDEDRRAFAAMLTREVTAHTGKVMIGDQPLAGLHQAVIAEQIGHASSRPVLFQGSFGDNVLLPIRAHPLGPGHNPQAAEDALRAGNSPDMLDADWLDAARVDAKDKADIIKRWCHMVDGFGSGGQLFQRAMDQVLDADRHPALAEALTALRPQVAQALRNAGLDDLVFRFEFQHYNPALPVVQNLLFATPRQPLPADALTSHGDYLKLLQELKLDDDLLELALAIMDGLRQIFHSGGTDHPLFLKTGLAPQLYDAALEAAAVHAAGKPLGDTQLATLLSVASSITAEQFGPAFPDRITKRILELRHQHGAQLRNQMSDIFAPVAEDTPLHGLSVLQNAIFGKISDGAGARAGDIRLRVAEVLQKNGIAPQVLHLVFDMPITLGGANLPAAFAEPLAVSRAAIKQPDILVLNNVMASFDTEVQAEVVSSLRAQLPEATIIHLAPQHHTNVTYDLSLDLQQGRIVGSTRAEPQEEAESMSADLTRKLKALENTALFSGLDRKQLRLLAFGARWYHAKAGQYVFHKNDPPTDGAYLVIEGTADLLLPDPDGGAAQCINTAGPGTLVGELGLIRSEPRALDMLATSQLLCLRLGEDEFLAVVENDATTAFKLLQVVAGYVRI